MESSIAGVFFASAMLLAGAGQAATTLLTPPPGWTVADSNVAAAPPGVKMLGVWREPAIPGQTFRSNINVEFQPFEGTLAVFGDESVTQIQQLRLDAAIESHGAATVCTGRDAFRLVWSVPWTPTLRLHFDQLVLKADHGVDVATYTRDASRPADPAALAALNTFCGAPTPA